MTRTVVSLRNARQTELDRAKSGAVFDDVATVVLNGPFLCFALLRLFAADNIYKDTVSHSNCTRAYVAAHTKTSLSMRHVQSKELLVFILGGYDAQPAKSAFNRKRNCQL